MQVHLSLILNDNSIVDRCLEVHPHESVARALQDVGRDADIAPVLPHVKEAVRIIDGTIFVDNGDYAQWLLGGSAAKPKTAQSHVVKYAVRN